MVFVFLFILGLCIGSFLNVVIDRSVRGESLFGRSHCESCKRKLSGIDLVPLLSFLFLKGKCRFCKAELSFWYPVVEITTGVMFVITYFVSSSMYYVFEVREMFSLFLVLFIVSSLIFVSFTVTPKSMPPLGFFDIFA